ncbi:MAG TPA: hypothetical protein VF573_13660 [Paraburkholderia sp.]|uniref:hypothetical protein n=1 Tax=Paraburkholderia sp. TaxID=1926495 RepID=UPI002ED4A5E3
MDRYLSKRHLANLLAASVVALIVWPAIAQANERNIAGAGIVAPRMHPLSSVRPARSAPSPYFADIPITVAGVYGATMLDMVAGAPILLVRWPKGCCSRSRKWRMVRGTTLAPVHPKADDRHVFFLWPQS